jgi:MFS family permease
LEQAKTDPTLAPPILFGDGDGSDQCRRNPDIQTMASNFTLYIAVIIGALSAVMSPKIGAWSDRNGRVKLLVVTSLGGFMTEVITILAYKYPQVVYYKWLLAGAVLEGLCGSFTAGFAVTHAYAADCTPPPKRSVTFGYFHACLFSGIALGPMAVAWILTHGGTLIMVFYIALGIHTFFMLFVLFVLPESLSKKRQKLARDKYKAENGNLLTDGYSWMGTFRTMNILSPLKILWPTGPGTSGRLRANLILLSIVDTTIFGVAMGSMNVFVLYTGYVLDWDTADTSLFISRVNMVRVCGLLVILPALNYLVRRRRQYTQRRNSGFVSPEPISGSDLFDLSIIRGAILLELFGYFGYATATTSKMFVASGVLAALGGIASPTLQASLTKHVPQDQIGQLLGATGLLHALARVIAPTIFGLIYAKTVATVPSTVFIFITGFFVAAFFFSWFIRPHGKQFILVTGACMLKFL